MNDLQTLRACISARVDSLDAQSKAALHNGSKLDYAAMQEATRLQTTLDVLTEYAPAPDPADPAPAARVLPRPTRLPRRAARPIPFAVTCAGYGLPFPATNAEADAPRLDIAA